MKYKFVAAYCVRGMGMDPEAELTTIFQDEVLHVYLTSDVTESLSIIDRQSALGAVMLGLAFGHEVDGTPQDAWQGRVREMRDARRKRYTNSGFVVVEVAGSLDITLPENCQKGDLFWLCMDAYDKQVLAESVHGQVAGALSAVRLAGFADYQFERVAGSSYLIKDDGEVVHSISISGGGAAPTVVRRVNSAQLGEMRELIVPLLSCSQLEPSIDLYSQSLNYSETRLRAFMAAWNALEQFIKEVKPKYRALWESELSKATTPATRKQTLNEIPDNGSKVARAFGMIACYLGEADTATDISEFNSLRDVRNGLSHELKDQELPVERVQKLMDKYLKAHLRHC